MTKYDWAPGMPFLPQFGGGKSFPQVFCGPIDGPAPPTPMFTDDAIFRSGKKGCFQIVALLDSPDQLPLAKGDITSVSCQIENGIILNTAETTYVVDNQFRSVPAASPYLEVLHDRTSCVRILEAEEYTAAGMTDAALATNLTRPAPLYYDPHRIKKDLGASVNYVIVRWDRMVFASCRDVRELRQALDLVQNCIYNST